MKRFRAYVEINFPTTTWGRIGRSGISTPTGKATEWQPSCL